MDQGKSLAIAAEFEPAHGLGRRRSNRVPVAFDSRIGRGGLDRALCRVTELAIHGARLQTYSAMRPGTMIWLTLPNVGHYVARVAWSDDFEAGVEFHTPLSFEVFEALTAQ